MEDTLLLQKRISVRDTTIDLTLSGNSLDSLFRIVSTLISALLGEFSSEDILSNPTEVFEPLTPSVYCLSDSECCSREGHPTVPLDFLDDLSDEECLAILTRLLKNFGEELLSGCKTPEKSSICPDEDCCCESG